MTNWISVLLLLALPALACGFPLPAGMMPASLSAGMCAVTEDAASCQMRVTAYDMMGQLESAAIDDLQMALYLDDGTSVTEMTVTGSYEYQIGDSQAGLGANIHAAIVEGSMTDASGTQSLSGVEFIVVGDQAYSSEDSGVTWVYEELEANALVGLGMLLGLPGAGGMGVDVFNEPSVFTVTAGPDTQIMGQTMHVQTLTLDLPALLGSAEALEALMASSGADALGIDLSEIGSAQDIAMLSMMLLPLFDGTEFATTLYIGADDGLIHRIEESYALMLDTTSMPFGAGGEEAVAMTLTYALSGDITRHNEVIAIAAPDDASAGEGLLSGGLGEGLFGN